MQPAFRRLNAPVPLQNQVSHDLKDFLTPEQRLQFFKFLYAQYNYEVESYPDLQSQAFRFSRHNGANNKGRKDKIIAPFLSGSFFAYPIADNRVAIRLTIVEPRPQKKIILEGEFSTLKAVTLYRGFVAENGSFEFESKKPCVLTVIKNYANMPFRIAAYERGESLRNVLRQIGDIVDKITSPPEPLRLAHKIEYLRDFAPTSCRELCFSGQMSLDAHGTNKEQLPFLRLIQLLMRFIESLKDLHLKGLVHMNALDGNICINRRALIVSIDSFEKMGLTGQIGYPNPESRVHDAGLRNYGIVTPFADIFSIGVLLLRTITLCSEDDFDAFISNPSNVLSEKLDQMVLEYAHKEGRDRGFNFPKVSCLEELTANVACYGNDKFFDAELDQYLKILQLIVVLKSLVVHIYESDRRLEERLKEQGDLKNAIYGNDPTVKFQAINTLYEGMPRTEEILEQIEVYLPYHSRTANP